MNKLLVTGLFFCGVLSVWAGGGDAVQVQDVIPTNGPYVWTNTHADVKLGSILLRYDGEISATTSVFIVNGRVTNGIPAAAAGSGAHQFFFYGAISPVQVKSGDKIMLVTSTTNASWSGVVTINNRMLE